MVMQTVIHMEWYSSNTVGAYDFFLVRYLLNWGYHWNSYLRFADNVFCSDACTGHSRWQPVVMTRRDNVLALRTARAYTPTGT